LIVYEFGKTTRRRRRPQPTPPAPPAGNLDGERRADDDEGDGAYLRCLDCLNWQPDGRGGGRCRVMGCEWAPPAVRAACSAPLRYNLGPPDAVRWCLYGMKRSESA